MERATMLREQASVLRALADSFDVTTIRHQLLDLAERCDELARSIETDHEIAGIVPRARTAGE